MSAEKKSDIFYATGRRKEAVARVWLKPGEGKSFVVNDTPFEEYFRRDTLKMIVNQPFDVTNLSGHFEIKATVEGGGPTGQAGALRLGIARALVQSDEALRSVLRSNGFLTRDPRKKERKKFGRKGARRSFQYTKR